ncbi:pyridoxal phosphate-dependent aminotransferase [Marivita sp. S0852]|uniref:pyridoxal phosphate-dependent aminotransferase n=1 Tax=Marivita sp. S0852 TaxID=3373893 RepID=UPI003981EDB3
MSKLETKFANLGAENAPGQEVRQSADDLKSMMIGDILTGEPVDFSHGDVDAFAPTPGAREAWEAGFEMGGAQAYTEYRGASVIRDQVADSLAGFTGAPVDAVDELIITPGTQGALFLALGAVVDHGTKVAIVEPDYFANRKLVTFFGGTILPVTLHYHDRAGLDITALEAAFEAGAKVFVFSTPNNPTGQVYSQEAITAIAALARQHDVTVIVDQLYSRLRYSGETYTHLRSCTERPANLVTIMGPSKTESLSGFRLGVAFGTASLIDRMEKLQAIVSLRAAGYSQSTLRTWFHEPEGWMEARIAQHEAIRDDLLAIFRAAGFPTATPQAGSYLFPELPKLIVSPEDVVRLLRIQAGVTVTPGSEFAPHTASSIRLNFSQDHAASVAAAHRIVDMVKRYQA